MREVNSKCAFGRLLDVMATLRSPGGCPWDAEQTPESLKRFLIEETYEVLEALDGPETIAIRDELGDLLLQIVFHARIFEEQGEFDMADVATAITEKLVRRHPHVFGTSTEQEPTSLLLQWEKIKARERLSRGQKESPLDGIPSALPALLRARKVIEKSENASPKNEPPPRNLQALLERYQAALAANASKETTTHLGDLLFALVESAAAVHVDAEESLRRAIDRTLSHLRQPR